MIILTSYKEDVFLIILIDLFTLLPRYEDDMVIVGNYNGYVKCAEAFLRLGLSHKVTVKPLPRSLSSLHYAFLSMENCV